jgi:hypothetical protein
MDENTPVPIGFGARWYAGGTIVTEQSTWSSFNPAFNPTSNSDSSISRTTEPSLLEALIQTGKSVAVIGLIGTANFIAVTAAKNYLEKLTNNES